MITRDQDTTEDSEAYVNIVFASDVMPDKAIIHDTDTFAVQWNAYNAGTADSPAFQDRLVVTSIPEGCPGSDDQEHPVVFDSDQDSDAANYTEPPLASGQVGPLMAPVVGPFPAGAYRLTVTLAGVAYDSAFNCIDIVASSPADQG